MNLQATSYTDLLESLDAGKLDVAITAKGKLPRMFVERDLFSDGFVCMLRKGHPALGKKRLTLPQYLALEHLLVSPGGTPGSYVDTELARRGYARRIALQVSSFLVAPQVVAETDLISTGPERLLRRASKHYPIVLVPTPVRLPDFDLCLVWHSRREHDPAHVWMRELIARAAAWV